MFFYVLGYVFSRGYVYCFWQMFQGLLLIKGLRLFRSLEYSQKNSSNLGLIITFWSLIKLHQICWKVCKYIVLITICLKSAENLLTVFRENTYWESKENLPRIYRECAWKPSKICINCILWMKRWQEQKRIAAQAYASQPRHSKK